MFMPPSKPVGKYELFPVPVMLSSQETELEAFQLTVMNVEINTVMINLNGKDIV